MEPKTLAEVLAANFRAAKARIGLSQEAVAARMRALGFSAWRYQTVGQIEAGKRRITAEEIMALAWVLDLSISAMMSPAAEDGEVQFPSGDRISARSMTMSTTAYNDRSVTWDGDEPQFSPDKGDVTVHVVVRPGWLAGPSTLDPAFAEGERPPLADPVRRRPPDDEGSDADR